MKTELKFLLGTFASVILIGLGILMGSYLTEQRIQKIEGSQYAATKIAIVNLDEGVNYEDSYRNFANEMLSSQKQELVITGLNDAKSGVENGTYAAYLIVPSDFSKNVVTINSEPKKSMLKYELGTNLSNIAKDKTTLNITELNDSLNDDLGYMYLYSVFNELHGGQNNALKVIGNDSKDKEVIMAISNIDLIESINLTEVDRLQNDIEQLDTVDDFNKNEELINTIDLAYKTYLGKTSEEIENIKSDSDNVKELNKELGQTISVIPTIESEGYSLSNTNKVLSLFSTNLNSFKAGTRNLLTEENTNSEGAISNYKANVKTFISQVDTVNSNLSSFNYYPTVKKNISDITASIDISKFASLSTSIDSLAKENEKNIVKKQIEEYIQLNLLEQFGVSTTPEDALQNIFNLADNDVNFNKLITEYSKLIDNPGITNLKEYYDYTRQPDNPLELPVYDENTLKENIINDLKVDLKSVYKTVYEDLDTYNNNFPKNAVDTTEITKQTNDQKNNTFDLTNVFTEISNFTSIPDTDIEQSISKDLKPLKDKQSELKTSLIKKSDNNLIVGDGFFNRLNVYDPLKFIDGREIEGFANSYRWNTSSVESKINSKDYEYKFFVDKSYNQANEHVDIIRQDISKYQQLSDEKLEKGLENAKSIKGTTSGENQKLMKELINTLPYSRLGNAENTATYQFIINPINKETVTLENNNINQTESFSSHILIMLIIASIGIIGILIYLKISVNRPKVKN